MDIEVVDSRKDDYISGLVPNSETLQECSSFEDLRRPIYTHRLTTPKKENWKEFSTFPSWGRGCLRTDTHLN